MKISRSPTTTSLDEYELMSDAKYRNYVQQIDKALKGFEYTSEWADLVNALGKLNKVLIDHNSNHCSLYLFLRFCPIMSSIM